ncbi:hypothetical protein ACEWY4_012283 [Coilia grayii]|uniref:Myb/SANT-like DNA-binding domain-containing protein n=1 Tax=Coilia grayii TaxID=363190 RepID=A0ABD1K022_9TELE
MYKCLHIHHHHHLHSSSIHHHHLHSSSIHHHHLHLDSSSIHHHHSSSIHHHHLHLDSSSIHHLHSSSIHHHHLHSSSIHHHHHQSCSPNHHLHLDSSSIHHLHSSSIHHHHHHSSSIHHHHLHLTHPASTTSTHPASTTTTSTSTHPASTTTTTSRAVPITTAVQPPPAKSSMDPSTVSAESEPETRHRITLLLLSLFDTHQIFHRTRKAIFYQKVSKDMERQGYAMTPEDVRKQLNNMLVTYKRIKDRTKSTGEERVSWEYYACLQCTMDDIFGGSGVGTAPPGTVVATQLFPPAPRRQRHQQPEGPQKG